MIDNFTLNSKYIYSEESVYSNTFLVCRGSQRSVHMCLKLRPITEVW